MTRRGGATHAALALAAALIPAGAGAQPVFLQGADSSTIASVLPPRAQGSNCCSTCAGNDACPDCACWATSMGMLLSYWDDYRNAGQGPWERLLPGGDRGDVAAYQAATQRAFDIYGGDACAGTGSGLFFLGYCADDRDTLTTYTSELGYSFVIEDHDIVSWTDDVVAELNTWKPVYYGYYPEGDGSHVVLLVGYDDADDTMWLYNTWDYAPHVKGFDEAFNHCVITVAPGGVDCTTGACCSGRFFVPAGTVCDADVMQEYGCPWGTGCGNDPAVRSRDAICSGEWPDCDTLGPWKEWRAVAECDDLQACGPDGTCVPGFGCACECTSGGCCDGCHVLPLDFECSAAPAEETQCAGGCGGTVQRREGPRRCTGAGADCGDDNVVWGEWADVETCGADEACAVIVGEARCEPCPLGCAGGACLPCVPDCGGRLCGADGCGGQCGICGPDYFCLDGFCAYDPPSGLAGGTGCGCRAAGVRNGPGSFLLLLAFALLLRRRRPR